MRSALCLAFASAVDRFRHERCVQTVADKHDEEMAAVVAAMLEISRPDETTLRQARSRRIGASEIESMLAKMVRTGAAPATTSGKSVISILKCVLRVR